MNLRIWRTAILACFTLDMSSLNEHVSVGTARILDTLLGRQWMSFSPLSHVLSCARITNFTVWQFDMRGITDLFEVVHVRECYCETV